MPILGIGPSLEFITIEWVPCISISHKYIYNEFCLLEIVGVVFYLSALWRVVMCLSIVYELALVFLLFQVSVPLKRGVSRSKRSRHEFHETCHSVIFIVLVNSHQR